MLLSILKKNFRRLLTGLVLFATAHLMAAFDVGTYFSNEAAWGEKIKSFQQRANGEAMGILRQSGSRSYPAAGIVALLSERNEGLTCIMPHMNLNGKKVEMLTFLGRSIYDFEVRYGKSGNPLYVTAYLYTRGDATSQQYHTGEMSYDNFTSTVSDVKKQISELTGKKPITRTDNNERFHIRRTFFIWHTAHVSYILDVNYTQMGNGNRVEYIKVIMASKKQADDLVDKYTKAPSRVSPKILKKKIQKNKSTRDVFLPFVPMVNQGQKGYCTAATTARILQYYGRSMGMHDVAQIANTTSENGTDSFAWFNSMTKVSQDLGIRIVPVKEFSVTESFNDYINRYNTLAQKSGKAPIDLNSFGMNRNVSQIFGTMDPKIRKASRNTQDLQKIFLNNVRKNINAGIPLIWSVELGLAGGEEEGSTPQARGGHTRLIIGYNDKKKIIYFSDTWGNKHEKKSIPLENAIFITTGLYILYPVDFELK